MTPLDEFIYRQPKAIREVLDFLNEYIPSLDPEIRTTIKWKVPYYMRRKSMCYMNVLKSGGVELNFIRGYFFEKDKKKYLDFKKR